MTRDHASAAVDTPAPHHWSEGAADHILDRERGAREEDASAAATQAQLAALIRSDGVIFRQRLAAELATIAGTINTRVGFPLLAAHTTIAAESLRASGGPYVLIAFSLASDPDVGVADVHVIVRGATWSTEQAYNFVNSHGALTIDGRGPEAFVLQVAAEWLRALPIGGR